MSAAGTATPAGARFACSLDRLARLVTRVFWAGSLAAAAVLLVVAGQIGWLAYPLALLSLAVPVALLLIQPRAYRLDGDGLTIERWWWPVEVRRSAIDEIRRLGRADDLGRVWRLLGSGGAHGYLGLFNSSTLGRLSFHATRRDTLVLVRRPAGTPLVLSPDDPEALLGHARRLGLPVSC